jgi:hypothetical protein
MQTKFCPVKLTLIILIARTPIAKTTSVCPQSSSRYIIDLLFQFIPLLHPNSMIAVGRRIFAQVFLVFRLCEREFAHWAYFCVSTFFVLNALTAPAAIALCSSCLTFLTISNCSSSSDRIWARMIQSRLVIQESNHEAIGATQQQEYCYRHVRCRNGNLD